ncbi:MAG: MFS transporter [Nibricoccus sp.]
MSVAALAKPALATRLAFLAAGFIMACWAPLVPYAKARVGADDRQLGLMLLCVGIGSLIAMPLTGWVSARSGSKPMIIGGGLGMVLCLPLLASADRASVLAAALLGFGASLGTLDVAMNIHGVEVERQSGRHLMSGFHAMFSLGGIFGAGAMTFLLSVGMAPLAAALGAAGAGLGLIALAWPRLLQARGAAIPLVWPHGMVMFVAGLCAIAFLVEGAILDWGALLVIGRKLVGAEHGGLGYLLFSVAMTVGRLSGDAVVARVGDRRILIWGGFATVAGFAVVLLAPAAWLAMSGFLWVGLGASNVVPVLFRFAGRQTVMPVGLAVAAITTTGYAGVLAGPAAVGLVSKSLGLTAAFWVLAALWALIPLSARRVTVLKP